MNEQDALFLSTRQPQKKLNIAIERLLSDGADFSGQYHTYLKQRLRPALLQTAKNGTPSMMLRLLEQFSVSDRLLLEAVKLCGQLGRAEMTAVLLQKSACTSCIKEMLPSSQPIPVRETQPETSGKDLPISELCEKILRREALHLYCNYPFFGNALAHLSFCPTASYGIGTDGNCIFYCPEAVMSYYKEGTLQELLLHMVFHCLFLHCFPPSGTDRETWDETCDTFVWHELSRMGFKHHGTQSAADCHDVWYHPAHPCASEYDDRGTQMPSNGNNGACTGLSPSKLSSLQKQWEHLKKQMPSASDLKRKRSCGVSGGSRLEWLLLRERGRYDFRSYLQRFCITAEEMQLDPDSFDPIPYYYGQQYLPNMPLIEPLETGETAKIQELVIAIDTSGSCSLPVVQRFLEETCTILTNREYFFQSVRVHLLQCDCLIQEHRIITSREEFFKKAREFQIHGRGGTDFRPVFTYVEKLRREKKIRQLKGLLYFTDGDGIYPQIPTDYETAFVFTDHRFLDMKVPDFIIPLCLELTPAQQ